MVIYVKTAEKSYRKNLKYSILEIQVADND